MIQGGDTELRLRLDALEAKGVRLIADQGRRQALTKALAWAAPAMALGGLAFAVSALIFQPSLLLAMVLVGLPTLFAGAWVYRRTRSAQAAERIVALAQLDHRFGIKDRIQTADEFERLADRSPFQVAALQEAAPWLDRAANASVASPSVLTVGPSPLWLWPALALVLVIFGFFATRFGSGGAVIAPQADADAASISVIDGSTRPNAPVTPGVVDRVLGRSAMSGNDKSATVGGVGNTLTATLRRLASMLSPDRGSAGGPRQPGKPGAAGEAAAGGGESAGRGAQGAAGRGGSRGVTAAEAEVRPPASDDQSPSGETGAEDQSDVASAPATNGQAAGGRQDAPSARQAEPRQSESNSSQNGEEGQQQQNGRSRRGDQGQKGGEQAGGQGDSGQSSGADAGAKKGRGVSSLLLATPMQDRLAGMASPGRTSTTTRDGAPQAFPVTPGQAGDRGVARGEAARTTPRTPSPQDQRLTRDYFTQRNAGGR